MGPIRILHCLPWVTSGGVERRRLELARRLDPTLYEQRVVCLRSKPAFKAEFERAGVRVHEVGEPYGLAPLARVAAVARVFRPTLVHGAVFEGVTMANIASLASCAPHLIVEEIDYPIHRSWRGNLLLRILAHRAKRCVAVSPSVMEYLTQRARIPASKARLIVNGTLAPKLIEASARQALKVSLGLDPTSFVVGSVGRLSDSHKRFSDLIRALALLTRQNTNLHLLIVGEGRDRAMLETLAQSLAVSDHVHFAGYQSDVGPMLSIMDVFALASERESFGLVLVEAMFSALPVIGTNVAGIRDIVVHEGTGLLVPALDPAALAAAIQRLHADADLRNRFGQAGRSRAESCFGAPRYVRDVEALYREVLNEGKGSVPVRRQAALDPPVRP